MTMPMGTLGPQRAATASALALAEAVHAKQAPVQHALADQRKNYSYVVFWNVRDYGSIIGPSEVLPMGVAQALAEAVHAKQAPIQHTLADQRKKKNYVEFWNVIPIKDPFRLVLSEMRDRLFHTREVLHQCLMQPTMCAGRTARGTTPALHIVLQGTFCRPAQLLYSILGTQPKEYIAVSWRN